MNSNDLITNVSKNSNDTAALIWSVADDLVGAYKPHEYGLVILPMTVIKRFHDCLLPTHQAVLDTYKKVEKLAVKDGFLKKASGYQFYNTSPFTFKTLLADPENIVDNFKAYLNGFSDNVQDILARMDFDSQIKHMSEAGLLYQVISDFCTDRGDFSPEKISAVDMGYVFENLVRRFSESYNEEAGAHFTSRDIIYLMSDLLVAGDDYAFTGDGISKTVYDMTMGTSQMLTCMEERLKQMDADADVTVFGQEFNPFTFGIAKADMLIRGGDPNNMQFGDTLSDDKFSGYKLKDDGQMAIIQNGSSLFNGDAGSGPSEIRRYLIENDWLDAIVQLPNNAFYNTGIATYIWLVMKNKPVTHQGKVQLIDASNCASSRRKNIGLKNVDITKACRDLIVKAYGAYVDETYKGIEENGNAIIVKSKVMDSVDLGYNKIVVETPQFDENGNVMMKKNKLMVDTSKRDTENVPLAEDIDAYFEREVIPYNPHAWVDKSKTKVGYEIPFTRTFYEYKKIEPSGVIAARIEEHEKGLMAKLHELFGGE